MRLGKRDIRLFWGKVDTTGEDECWYRGRKPEETSSDTSTYTTHSFGEKKVYISARVAWVLTFGPIPEGKEVCHRCDHPRCVNPRHLFLGTHAENMRDMSLKGRASRGKPRRKLTDEEVVEIRDSPLPAKVFMQKHGISKQTVSVIRCKKVFKELL